MSESDSSSLSVTNLLRIIVGAMILGVLIFAGFVAFQRQEITPLEFGSSPLDYVIAVLVPVQLVVSRILPRQMLKANCLALALRTNLQTPADEIMRPLRQSYLVTAIVAGALAEAACFVVLIVLLLGGPSLLWVLVAVGLLMIAVRFPRGESHELSIQGWHDYITELQQVGFRNDNEDLR